MISSKYLRAAMFGGMVATASASSAHHSFAMFDNSKVVTLTGTVKDFQWSNPHIWIELVGQDANGQAISWSIEGPGPTGLRQRGWSRTTIKPGDKVTLTMHPLKSGMPGGSIVSITVGATRLEA